MEIPRELLVYENKDYQNNTSCNIRLIGSFPKMHFSYDDICSNLQYSFARQNTYHSCDLCFGNFWSVEASHCLGYSTFQSFLHFLTYGSNRSFNDDLILLITWK